MGPKKGNKPIAPTKYKYTSDSSDDDDSGSITVQRYRGAQLLQALTRRCDRVRALQELAGCIAVFKECAEKPAQVQILEDLLAAISICAPDRRAACKAALDQVVKTAERVLPQQKRSQVAAEYKKHSLASHRAQRKQGAVVDADDPDFVFDSLPVDVLQHMFKALDPMALAHAACTCAAWRAAAEDDVLWAAHLQAFFPKQASAARAQQQAGRSTGPGAAPVALPGGTGTSAQPAGTSSCDGSRQQCPRSAWAAFTRLASSHSEHVSGLCSGRRLVKDRLVWLEPAASRAGAGQQGQATQQQGGQVARKLHEAPISVEQVVAFLRCGRVQLTRVDASSSCDPDSSDGADDDGADAALPARQMRLWALK